MPEAEEPAKEQLQGRFAGPTAPTQRSLLTGASTEAEYPGVPPRQIPIFVLGRAMVTVLLPTPTLRREN